MLNCLNCGHFFDEPLELDAGYDTHIGFVQKYQDACPRCRGTEIEDAERCPCGRFEHYRQYDEPLCWECKAELKKKVREFMEMLTYNELEQISQWNWQVDITEFEEWEELP